MNTLSPSHFLSLPRPHGIFGPPSDVPDTTTLAAHDFDVDTRTGFMPPQPPLARLPPEWDHWEAALHDGLERRLALGDDPAITEHDIVHAEDWRRTVREMPVLPITNLKSSEPLLRRAHHVLAWLAHLYAHSLPPLTPILLPPPLSLPLLLVSSELALPPLLTYSDDVLYNWAPTLPGPPTPTNLRTLTTFTDTPDEQAFYLTSASIELRGVEALELMRSVMDEAFLADAIAHRRITSHLAALARVIDELRVLLLGVRAGCDPEVFYHRIRPWFKGGDVPGREWVFEGEHQVTVGVGKREMSGPSAGQSTLIHALDIFLGVDEYSHDASATGDKAQENISPSSASSSHAGENAQPRARSFLNRMQAYMPRHHRAFLTHLAANPRPLRTLVLRATDGAPPSSSASPKDLGYDPAALRDAYNGAVRAMRTFRDAHMGVVRTYIVAPARRAGEAAAREHSEVPGVVENGSEMGEPEQEKVDAVLEEAVKELDGTPLKGTGGTDLVSFLKRVRERTANAVIDGV